MYLNEISKTIAYWISPRGEVVEVNTNHIDVIIKNPEKFGYKRDQIQAIYDKYDEPLGKEGEAREEIILALVKKGYIRIRKYGNQGYTLNIGRMTKKVKDILFDWASKLISTGIKGMKEKDVYSDVRISSFTDSYTKRLSLQDVANDKLYEGTESFNPSNKVIIVESAEDFTYEPKTRLVDDL
jgi:hypothetical protein